MLTDADMINAIEREEAHKLAEAVQKVAKKLVAAQKKSQIEDVQAQKRLKVDAWEVARLDNDSLLETWEATKLAAHEHDLVLPPKP